MVKSAGCPCGRPWLRALTVLAEDPGLTSSTLGTPAPGQARGTDTYRKTLIHVRDKMKQMNQGTLGRGKKSGIAGTEQTEARATELLGVFYQDGSVKQRYLF